MVQTSLKIGDYEAWVEVENQKIEHYGIDANEETNVVTGWIASTAGKHFGISIAKSHSRFDCAASIEMDGSYVHGVILRMSNTKPELRDIALTGEDSGLPFVFGVLNVTEDEPLLGTMSYEQVGTIKVVIYHITNLQSQDSAPTAKVPENVTIHERAKKSFTHQVLFGEAKTTTKKYVNATYTPGAVVATFVFRYRSLDMLKAHGIVPCDPPPVETEGPSESGPVSRKRKGISEEEEEQKPVVETSDPEDEEDQRKEAQLEAELERIRNARLKRQTKKIKCEPKPIFLPGEIIDLTI